MLITPLRNAALTSSMEISSPSKYFSAKTSSKSQAFSTTLYVILQLDLYILQEHLAKSITDPYLPH